MNYIMAVKATIFTSIHALIGKVKRGKEADSLSETLNSEEVRSLGNSF